MFPRSKSGRLLLLGGAARCAALGRLLAAVRPDLEMQSSGPAAREWLPQLAAGPWAGVVVAAEDLSAADLGTLEAGLGLHPQMPCLLVAGGRGLAGAGRLLGRPGLRVLPEPVTLEAAEALLAGPRGAPPEPGGGTDESGSGAIFHGVVEGLRDPLTSLSGYLQLLRAEGSAGGDLLEGALAAAGDLNRLIDALALACSPRRPRPGRVLVRELAEEAADAAWGPGRPARVRLDPGLEITADRLTLGAALYTSGLFLARFGPAGEPEIDERRAAGGLEIAWRLPPPDARAAGRQAAPPDLLPRVLARLAARMEARPIIDRAGAAVPIRAGLAWETQPGP